MQKFQLNLKITINKYFYLLAMVWRPKLDILIFLLILKRKRFGDVALAGKLIYADLCKEPELESKKDKEHKGDFDSNGRADLHPDLLPTDGLDHGNTQYVIDSESKPEPGQQCQD